MWLVPATITNSIFLFQPPPSAGSRILLRFPILLYHDHHDGPCAVKRNHGLVAGSLAIILRRICLQSHQISARQYIYSMTRHRAVALRRLSTFPPPFLPLFIEGIGQLMVLEAVVAQVSDAVRDMTVSRYLCAVALVLSIYDWILLVGDEYRTVWQSNWTLPKAIYYINRIVTITGLVSASYQLSDLRHGVLSAKFCQVYIYLNSLIELFSFFLANWLLTLRLVALYKRNKPLIWFLYTFLLVSYAITAFFMIYTLYKYSIAIYYSTIVHACASTTKSKLMPAVFLAPAAFEFTLFTLTGYRAWQDVKLMRSSSSAPFLVVLYRDGIVCFFIMFGIRIWNVWIYATQPITTAYLGIYLLWATMTILSTRVYLNLHFLTCASHTDLETEFTIGQPVFAVPVNPGMTTTNAIFANITQGDLPISICLQERSTHSPESPNYAGATFLNFSDTETIPSNDRLESSSRPTGHRPFSTLSLSFASMPSSTV